MTRELSPIELTILRHYFTGTWGGGVVVDPDGTISRCKDSHRGGTSLWPDGPSFQTTSTGVVLHDGIGGDIVAELRWSRVRQWVRDLPRAERDALVAAETVYRQRRLTALESNGGVADHDPRVREAAAVRDAAFIRCIDSSAAAAQPALFNVPEHRVVQP